MEQQIKTAEILIESLPYIKKFSNKTVVIKYGGHAMVNPELKKCFAQDITLLKYIGINPVIIHGGGPQINEYLDKFKIKSKFINGMRITDDTTMDIVEMVLAGKINKQIVSLINREGGNALGLSGKDCHLIKAKKLKVVKESKLNNAPEIIDIGLVGEITNINSNFLKDLLSKGNYIPVIAPVGYGSNNETFNINADIVTGHIAASLQCEKVIYLTDVQGIMENGKLIQKIKIKDINKLKTENIITGGMLPKIDSSELAIKKGTKTAHIIDGRIKHSILLEMFTDTGIGTLIRE